MGATFKVAPGVADPFDFWLGSYFFHSVNQPMILKKLREKVEWGDQVYKDDGHIIHNSSPDIYNLVKLGPVMQLP